MNKQLTLSYFNDELAQAQTRKNILRTNRTNYTMGPMAKDN